jgi:glycosyltransferase involved in cell wall biosynthesis
VFVQTSRHEGFCLPLLEAMAAGAPVVCTDAHGNRDFCRHEVNCLLVDADPAAVAAGVSRVLADPALRERLAREGRRTAEEHRWERRMDEVAAFFERVAQAKVFASTKS